MINSRKRILTLAGLLLLLASLACGLPSTGEGDGTEVVSEEDALGTIVAQTAQALLTSTAVGDGDTATPEGGGGDATATSTVIPKPSDTPGPTNTPGVTGCINAAQFVSDVTIPDDTEIAPGATFEKTWRLGNNGTCNWTTAYQFAFVDDSQMNAPPSVGISGTVPPGSQYDVTVTFTAPTTPGTYTSTWQMRTADGAVFGTRTFVRIVVPAPTATATATVEASATPGESATPTPTATSTSTGADSVTVTIDYDASASGQMSSGGSKAAAPNVGDKADNTGLQSFVTFDLSGIPSGATITKVEIDLRSFDTLGDPFTALGCLRIYHHNYGTLDSGDYTTGSPLGALWRFCSLGSLTTPGSMEIGAVDTVQAAIGGTYQLRLQFNETETNNDDVADVLRPSPSLVITYLP